MSRRKTQEEFEKEVYEVHKDNVVILGKYQGLHTPIEVKYIDCGHEEMKLPIKLIKGHGCIKCRFKRLSRVKTKTTEEYKSDLLQNGLDYIELLSEYNGVDGNIKILNKRCGHIYSARAGNILNRKSGCPICHGVKDDDTFRKIIEEKYPGEYSIKEPYVNGLTPILIKHNDCGYECKCAPKSLLSSRRCPRCMISKGERCIASFLELNNIPFEQQVIMDGCKDILGLPFDFKIVIKGKVKLIEFDGEQHYQHTRTRYRTSKIFEHDQMTNEYCTEHNIPLLRIPYWMLKSDAIYTEIMEFIRE